MTLTALYRDLLRLRLIEEAIAARYTEWEMRCPTHLSVGQEAAAVGVCSALEQRDYVLSGHRSHGHFLAKGGDLRAMLAEIYGKATGCSSGKGGSMHLIDLAAGFLGAVPIVGSTIPIAVGVGLGIQQAKEDRVSVAFFGDGATEEGVFAESLNYAALSKLPVVFVCENNLYSVYSPIDVRQPTERDLLAISRGHGVPALHGDGNDVEEVQAMTQEAVARARGGGGPTLLLLDTYRWREHCGPHYDDQLGYRPEGELERWKKLCCVTRAADRLRECGELDDAKQAALEAEFQAEIEEAFAFAKSSPFPEESELTRHVYAGGDA